MFNFVTVNRLCQNCLSKSHSTSHCSSRVCWMCGEKHHTILHKCFDNKHETGESSLGTGNKGDGESNSITLNSIVSNQVLLATVLVNVQVAPNKTIVARCLLDSGSQLNLVTDEFFQQTGLSSFKQSTNIFGISGNKTLAQNYIKIFFQSLYDKTYKFQEQCAIVNTITVPLPHYQIDATSLNIPSKLFLADKTFNIPGLGINMPVIHHTRFGYVVAGNVFYNEYNCDKTIMSNIALNFFNVDDKQIDRNLDEILQKFWQLEEISLKHTNSNDFKRAECQFLSTVQYKNNKFCVTLPFASNFNDTDLNGSYQVALKRFMMLEK